MLPPSIPSGGDAISHGFPRAFTEEWLLAVGLRPAVRSHADLEPTQRLCPAQVEPGSAEGSALSGRLAYLGISGSGAPDGHSKALFSGRSAAFSPSATSDSRGGNLAAARGVGHRLRSHSEATPQPGGRGAPPLGFADLARNAVGAYKASLRAKSQASLTLASPSQSSWAGHPHGAMLPAPSDGVAASAVNGYLASLRVLSASNVQRVPLAAPPVKKLASLSMRSPSRDLGDLAALLNGGIDSEAGALGLPGKSLRVASDTVLLAATAAGSAAASASGVFSGPPDCIPLTQPEGLLTAGPAGHCESGAAAGRRGDMTLNFQTSGRREAVITSPFAAAAAAAAAVAAAGTSSSFKGVCPLFGSSGHCLPKSLLRSLPAHTLWNWRGSGR